MADALIDKLLNSFDELDRCIQLTKDVLSKKRDVPADVLDRVEQYSAIVSKQRGLANMLEGHLADENWEEVGRHVKLINGLSSMIRDDARSILAGAGLHPATGTEKPAPKSELPL